ncbi:hypothetical protein DRE_05249 [Drechslerella stenobrocha 248]|uniref:Rhodopsin domain-containing protein n=1 Tax=Drechslerella stenobrocha 248 TaxID=1043628 RepID=W7I0E8_9PEZI|nr:hypothetical protein DRE_05249 [Drechslerella stenobrocha 248]
MASNAGPSNSSDRFIELLNSTGIDLRNYSSGGHHPLLSEPIPPEVIASWPAPNYIDPETKHAQMFGWELGLLGVATLAVILRLYVRIWMMRPLWGVGGDDWGIGIALLFAIGLTTVQLNATRYGYGTHIWDVKPEWITPMRQMAFCTQIFFVLCTTTVKLSILYFYLRLSASPTFRFLVHSGMCFVLATGVSFLFVIIFQCTPISGYWDLSQRDSHCVHESAANIANAVINSLSDLYVFSLPIRDMMRLRLPLRQRVSLVVLFSLGGVVCIVGWLRVWQLTRVLKWTYDNTWYGPTMYILTAVECDVAILCSCLPALKPLITKAIPSLRRMTLRRISGAAPGSGGESDARRGSSGVKGKDSLYAGDSAGDYAAGRRRGAVSGMSLGRCPYSDPTKLVDPTNLLPAQLTLKRLVSDSGSFPGDLSIPLYEQILKSTSRLPYVPGGEESDKSETQDLQGPDLEKGHGVDSISGSV